MITIYKVKLKGSPSEQNVVTILFEDINWNEFIMSEGNVMEFDYNDEMTSFLRDKVLLKSKLAVNNVPVRLFKRKMLQPEKRRSPS
jgi:hypothetical protein